MASQTDSLDKKPNVKDVLSMEEYRALSPEEREHADRSLFSLAATVGGKNTGVSHIKPQRGSRWREW